MRLKKLVAELSLDKAILRDGGTKKWPALTREVVESIVRHSGLAIRRACRLVKQHRSNRYYSSIKDPKLALRARMREIAQPRIRYGYRRIHVLLRREGWQRGRSQAHRIYGEEQLQLRSKLPKRRKVVMTRQVKVKPARPHEAWSMDFVLDQLSNGAKFRTLTIVDVYGKEALAIEVGQRLRSEHVVAVLNRLTAQRGHRSTYSLITAVDFLGACWICGPTITRHESTAAALASLPTIAISSRLTDHSEMNV